MCPRLRLLDETGDVERRYLPKLFCLVQDQEIAKREWMLRTLLRGDELRELQISFTTSQDHRDLFPCRAPVIWGGAPIAELTLEDRVDSATGPLYQPGPLERVRQQRVARAGRRHQQVVLTHAVGEAARVADL